MRISVCVLLGLLYTNFGFCASLPLNGPPDIPVPFSDEKPTVVDKFLDTTVGHPLLYAMTVVGAGLFVVTLPSSIVGKEVPESADTFMLTPLKAATTRCWGCSVNFAKEDKES